MVRRVAKEVENLLVNRIHDHELTRCAARYFTGRMLDIGGGCKPCEALLAPYLSERIGACEGSRKAVDEFMETRSIRAVSEPCQRGLSVPGKAMISGIRPCAQRRTS